MFYLCEFQCTFFIIIWYNVIFTARCFSPRIVFIQLSLSLYLILFPYQLLSCVVGLVKHTKRIVAKKESVGKEEKKGKWKKREMKYALPVLHHVSCIRVSVALHTIVRMEYGKNHFIYCKIATNPTISHRKSKVVTLYVTSFWILNISIGIRRTIIIFSEYYSQPLQPCIEHK